MGHKNHYTRGGGGGGGGGGSLSWVIHEKRILNANHNLNSNYNHNYNHNHSLSHQPNYCAWLTSNKAV
jgi:hypothetical protein